MKSDREQQKRDESSEEQPEKFKGSDRSVPDSDEPVSSRVGWAGDPSGALDDVRERRERMEH